MSDQPIHDKINELWDDHSEGIGNFVLDDEYKSDHLKNLESLHAIQELENKKESEIRGAYRAGYNYLTIGERVDGLSVGYVAFPSYTEPDPEGWKPKDLVDDTETYRWVVYDLDIDPKEYRMVALGMSLA